jgi:hypothetical protein
MNQHSSASQAIRSTGDLNCRTGSESHFDFKVKMERLKQFQVALCLILPMLQNWDMETSGSAELVQI